MHKDKEKKTNAMRIVEQEKVDYNVYHYAWKEDALDAIHVADELKLPPEQIFKTLVAVGDKHGVLVGVIPSHLELDLKKLAKASGNKRVEMLHLKELEKTTGYIRGGCSPVGMKKSYPTYVGQEIDSIDEILISAGRRGTQMGLAPADFLKVTGATVCDITKEE
ncbi:MAG: Cys-tRNA(Pro) deacylase [Peptococcaceae bacterium]|nr:Cys-tRNA(Pro) deacylase [Peptococcaceae bacterium]